MPKKVNIPSANDVDLQKKLEEIDAFFDDPKNIKLIKANQINGEKARERRQECQDELRKTMDDVVYM